MKQGLAVLFLIIAAVLVFVGYNALYTVHQTRQALLLQFGKVVRPVTDPGLHFKVPFVQNVEYIDNRILDLDSPAQEVIASDQKRLVVDAFARYKITDPLKFYQAASGDLRIANQRLSVSLNSAVRRVLGDASFSDAVRDKRESLMEKIENQVNIKAANFGVRIVDVRIKRADLPEANSQAIYRRMQTERQREAAEFRAEGEEQARRIRATADRKVTVLKANATRDSEKIRGDGDAKRNATFAAAFGQDADFFAFYRSMQAYVTGLRAGDTRMILSPDSDFFRYFNDPMGARPKAAPAQ